MEDSSSGHCSLFSRLLQQFLLLFPPSMVDQSCSSLSGGNVVLVEPTIRANRNGKKSGYKLLSLQEGSRST